jgi:uncharacterized protein (DUF362 family)
MNTVALVKHKGDLSVASRSRTLKEAIQLIGGFGSLKSPFVIKPNLCTAPFWDISRFATTNVKMVEAVATLALREDDGLSVKIVESDSVDKFADETTFAKYGYKDLEERLRVSGLNVSLVNLSQPPFVKVKHDGLYLKELELHKLLTEPKYFVSVALAKTHAITYITGTVKNLFGLLPKKDKKTYHPKDKTLEFNQLIIDLTKLATPDLCIIDAIVGMEGVVTGRPKRINALIVGRDPVSVDATMTRLMGLEPERIYHLVEAEKHGLGTLNPKVVGDSLESMVVEFNPPSTLRPAAIIS